MPDTNTPTDAMRQAADAVRRFNHLSLPADGFASPPQVSEAAQALCQLLDRLPQAVSQLNQAIQRHQRQGLVRMDNGQDPHRAVLAVDTHLTDTETDLADVSAHAHKAASILFAMGATQ